MTFFSIAFILVGLCSFVLYVFWNDRKLLALPPNVEAISPGRTTRETIRSIAKDVAAWNRNPVVECLPPATGRRYIIVGGAGFLGGWIVLHLLERGEDPRFIRIVDIRPPTRRDLLQGKAKEVRFVQADISNRASVNAAFEAPWPSSEIAHSPLTVFHTASIIRFYERHVALLRRSERVNVDGTQNVIDAAKAAGASVLVYTSSGSIAVRASHFLLWPWQKEPKFFVQAIKDDDNLTPKENTHYFSNYSRTKANAEKLVREADGSVSGSGSILKTGCIRPSNGVYGPGGDLLAGAYLVRKTNPTWVQNIIHNFIHVENCSLAHLCYEQRLVEQIKGSSNPDLGGQTFIVTDAGAPPTYGDVYLSLTELTDGECQFPLLSPTAMLVFAYAVEATYLARELYISSPNPLVKALARLVPQITSDVVNVQPSLWSLMMVHLIFDDSRARLPPSQGGLGYNGPLTTLQGMCRLVEEHRKSDGNGEERSRAGGGVTLNFLKNPKHAKETGVHMKEGVPVMPQTIEL